MTVLKSFLNWLGVQTPYISIEESPCTRPRRPVRRPPRAVDMTPCGTPQPSLEENATRAKPPSRAHGSNRPEWNR